MARFNSKFVLQTVGFDGKNFRVAECSEESGLTTLLQLVSPTPTKPGTGMSRRMKGSGKGTEGGSVVEASRTTPITSGALLPRARTTPHASNSRRPTTLFALVRPLLFPLLNVDD